MNLAAFDAALLDLDGTLVDTLPDFVAALDLALDELGLPRLPAPRVAALIGRGMDRLVQDVLAEAAPHADAARLERARGLVRRHYAAVNGRGARVYPGVVDGLRALRGAGLKLACVTNKPDAFARPLLAALGLAPWFDGLWGGDTFARLKPDPLPLLEACRHLGVAPARTLAIGDSRNDALAAQAAGCALVLVRYGYNHGEPVDSIAAAAHVDSLAALAAPTSP